MGKTRKIRFGLNFRWGERLRESELLKTETTTVRSSPKPRLVNSIRICNLNLFVSLTSKKIKHNCEVKSKAKVSQKYSISCKTIDLSTKRNYNNEIRSKFKVNPILKFRNNSN